MDLEQKPELAAAWMDSIPDAQWNLYCDAIGVIRRTNQPFLLGGGFGLAVYTGRWRNTKDLDFYVPAAVREPIIASLKEAGFSDYFDKLAYDRGWIYRAFRDGVIVDLIWSMANRRAIVDETWLVRANDIVIREERLKVVPPEELLWCKLYVIQRDHCDWPDVINLLYAQASKLDWPHLLTRLGEDIPLLRALCNIFAWACPSRAAEIPEPFRKQLNIFPQPVPPEEELRRIRLLDSRAWFAAVHPPHEPLEV